jgi:glutamyl-tRNA synthetase
VGEEEIRHLALLYALDNATRHGGKALPQPVLSKLLGSRPELRPHAKELLRIVEQVVDEVNKLSPEEQKARFELLAGGELPAKRGEAERTELPPLPNAEKGRVVTRFAPNPDFVLHLGSARPAILSYEYARMYDGRFILRFEDTDPKTKSPMLEAYDLIRDDLRWLGLKWNEEYIQSLRMEIYYEYAKRLIELGGAYVCTCSKEEISRNRAAGTRCACASRSAEEQLELWERMLAGDFEEGEAVLRLKTDIKHPNPSVRDWIAFRVIDTEQHPHPLVGSKYVAWPTYNFACAIDDHLMGITHILRGAEHEINTLKQKYIYEYFGWTYPTAIHFGRLGIEGAILSKSKIREGIRAGLYTGYDDIRLATLRALRRRGILPEAIRELMMHVGIKASTARISLENLYSTNRKYLEAKANRYMFVPHPLKLKLRTGSSELIARIPRHPSYPERGVRELKLAAPSGYCEVYVPQDDVAHLPAGSELRLLGLANIKLLDLSTAEVVNLDVDYARTKKLPIIQWAPAEEAAPAVVLMVKEGTLVEVKGVAEPGVTELKTGEHAQLYRFGFAILEDRRSFRFIYTHA